MCGYYAVRSLCESWWCDLPGPDETLTPYSNAPFAKARVRCFRACAGAEPASCVAAFAPYKQGEGQPPPGRRRLGLRRRRISRVAHLSFLCSPQVAQLASESGSLYFYGPGVYCITVLDGH